MTNTIDVNGITITTSQETYDALVAGYKLIYGDDINIDQNSPDGQNINIQTQSIQDLKELIVQVYTSFDPDNAVGTTLDARAAINNVYRQGSTYTYVNINITVNQALNLVGLDDTTENTPAKDIGTDVFTIQDDSMNQFVLENSQSFISAGIYNVSFRAKDIGQIITNINTITTTVSKVLGVVSVNNPAAATITGADEESDTELRLRRQNTLALGSIGFFESMQSALNNNNNITDNLVIENTTNSTDADGIPPHSYWIVVLGGSDEEVAQIIYDNRSGGTNFKGSETVNVEQIDGSEFEVKFDRAVNENLYVSFEVKNLTGATAIDTDFVKTEIVRLKRYKINETANKTDLEVLIKTEILPNSYIKDLQVSNDDISYYDTLDATSKKNVFVLDVSRISITII